MTCDICITTTAGVTSLTRSEAKQVTAMQIHLQYTCSSGAFLSALLLLTFSVATSTPTPGGHTTSFEQLFSTDPNNATFTPLCDDVQLRHVAQQVAQLKISTENILLLLDLYKLRLDSIKTLLDERLPEVYTKPYWIDVRDGVEGHVESISSTHASTGGVIFPSLSTQSSACDTNTPATDFVPFVGAAYLPVIEMQSSSDLYSSTTDTSTSSDCNTLN